MIRFIILLMPIVILFMGCNKEMENQEETIYSEIIYELIDDNSHYEGLNIYLKNKGISIEDELIDIDSIYSEYLKFRKIKINKTLYISRRLKPIDYEGLKILKDERKLNSIFLFEHKEDRLLDLDLIYSEFYNFKNIRNNINFDLEIGAIEFSRIYFNSDKSQGFFYFKFLCGSLCGYENYVFLKKENNRWKITKQELIASY